MTSDAKGQIHSHMLQKNQVHYKKKKQTCTLKCQGLKKILLFIQPMFIWHLLHFPGTILGTENTVVNNTSPCSGGVYILV